MSRSKSTTTSVEASDLRRALNLGPTSTQWLLDAGITSLAQVRALGVSGVFEKLLQKGLSPSLNLAYALEGALQNCHWQKLSAATRGQLILAIDAVRQRNKQESDLPPAEHAMQPSHATRCSWCGSDSLYVHYHDTEWGVPLHDEHGQFEQLILEGAQAGLSWITILRKREGYRAAFHQFNPERVARMTEADVSQLLQNPGIVRHRGKIEAAISNAQAWLNLREKHDSVDAWLWQFVDGTPQQNHWQNISHVPASTAISDKLSRELKRNGFRFVGSTTCYAFMQAVGMVNDHFTDCFRHAELQAKRDHKKQ